MNESVKRCYVYGIYGKDKQLLYIGKGVGDRHKSHLSGTSSNRHINEYFFNNGQDGCLYSKIMYSNLTSGDALEQETILIRKHRPPMNTVGAGIKLRINVFSTLDRVKGVMSKEMLEYGMKTTMIKFDQVLDSVGAFINRYGMNNLHKGVIVDMADFRTNVKFRALYGRYQMKKSCITKVFEINKVGRVVIFKFKDGIVRRYK